MNLNGVKINFLGDSITYGMKLNSPESRFTSLLEAQKGILERNYGISGTRIAIQKTPSQDPSFDLDFCSRVSQMDADADMVVVFGGTNDFEHGDAPFGTPNDRTADTFYGALHVLYKTLLERFPSAKIVILTPLRRLDEQSVFEKNMGLGKRRLQEYVRAICEVAAVYGLTVLDLYQYSACLVQGDGQEYLFDGLHPNEKGHVFLARTIGAFLESLDVSVNTNTGISVSK